MSWIYKLCHFLPLVDPERSVALVALIHRVFGIVFGSHPQLSSPIFLLARWYCHTYWCLRRSQIFGDIVAFDRQHHYTPQTRRQSPFYLFRNFECWSVRGRVYLKEELLLNLSGQIWTTTTLWSSLWRGRSVDMVLCCTRLLTCAMRGKKL